MEKNFNHPIEIRNALHKERDNVFRFANPRIGEIPIDLKRSISYEYFDSLKKNKNHVVIAASKNGEMLRNGFDIAAFAFYSIQDDYLRLDAVYVDRDPILLDPRVSFRRRNIFSKLMLKILENERDSPKDYIRFVTWKGSQSVKKMAEKLQCRKIYDLPPLDGLDEHTLELYETDFNTARDYFSRFSRR